MELGKVFCVLVCVLIFPTQVEKARNKRLHIAEELLKTEAT